MTYRDLDKDSKIQALEEQIQELEKENKRLLSLVENEAEIRRVGPRAFGDSILAQAMKENREFFMSTKEKNARRRQLALARTAETFGLTVDQYRKSLGIKDL